MTDWFLNISCILPVSIMRWIFWSFFSNQHWTWDFQVWRFHHHQSLASSATTAYGWVFWSYFMCLNMSNVSSVKATCVSDQKTHIPMIFPWYSHDFPMFFPCFSHDLPISPGLSRCRRQKKVHPLALSPHAAARVLHEASRGGWLGGWKTPLEADKRGMTYDEIGMTKTGWYFLWMKRDNSKNKQLNELSSHSAMT